MVVNNNMHEPKSARWKFSEKEEMLIENQKTQSSF